VVNRGENTKVVIETHRVGQMKNNTKKNHEKTHANTVCPGTVPFLLCEMFFWPHCQRKGI